MHDSPAVGMGEPVEDLRRRLDGSRVRQLARPHRLSERATADVLVRDVDVAGIGAEAVRAEAALVAEPRGGLRLALGPVRGLALARDDLERDVETGLLVAREPDRAGRSGAERAKRAVPVENELPRGEYGQCGRHVLVGLAASGENPFPADAMVTVARIDPPTA